MQTKKNDFLMFLIVIFLVTFVHAGVSEDLQKISHLNKQGLTTQLIVDQTPFIILGGELGNSTFTSLEYMAPIWPKLEQMHLNTVLAPVYWEIIEPVENQFDFTLYDQLIKEARKHHLRLVLLWFGSWKNSMSSHAPSWIKLNQVRFPRVKDNQGRSKEILTPFSDENLNADLNAFKALMEHLKKIDGKENTVIMIQPENEIGMLPVPRDHSSLANQKFKEEIPSELIRYLKDHRESLVPEFKKLWEVNGFKESGSWEDIFGESVSTDEIFMAWYFAQYTNKVAEAGKAIYPLPMYVNAALNRPGSLPGYSYPSAGPLPHLMDVWKAGAPSIDFLSPDIYFPDIEHWCDLYVRQGNPLFIPEIGGGPAGAAKALFTLGHYESMGFSPFSIESTPDPGNDPLGKAYQLVDQLMPVISENQGKNRIEGMMFDKDHRERIFRLGNYEFTAKHSYTLGYEANSKNVEWETTGALIVQTGDSEFYLAGTGVVITVKDPKNPELIVGILKAEEGRFANGRWKVIRHLNGDQTHQGRHIRILRDDGFFIQRFELYRYE